jgi:glycosyltransferase involved in cell wall biosynthesis
MKKMNVLFVTEYFPPYCEGGAEISTSLIVKEISKYHNCYILTGNFRSENWTFENSEVLPLLKKYDTNKKSLKRILIDEINYYINFSRNRKIIQKIVDEKKIDLIHIIPTGYYAFPILKSSLSTGKPLMIDARVGTIACPVSFSRNCEKKFSLDFKCIKCSSENYYIDLGAFNFIKLIFSAYESLRFKILKGYSIRKIKKSKNIVIVSVSKYIKNLLIEAGYPGDKIEVIHNISDERTTDENIYNRENRLIFAGTLEKAKGIWDAIKAYEILNDPALSFYIAGDGRETGAIKQYILDNGLKGISLLGRVGHQELLELYSKSKIIIAPSVWPEPFGRFVLESIITKTPVISTLRGGIPEGIRNGETGLLVEPNNPGQLVKAIKKLLSDNKLYNLISDNLSKEAEKYSPGTIGKQRIDLYIRIINSTL